MNKDEYKCLPILLYGLEVCPLSETNLRLLDFPINRFFMKLFNTNDMQIVTECQSIFNFRLPNVINRYTSLPCPAVPFAAFVSLMHFGSFCKLHTSDCWWRSTLVERRSLTGELSLSCARHAADG